MSHRLASIPYYRLKIRRAHEHLAEIKRHVAVYENRHMYSCVRDVDTDPNPRHFMFRAHLVQHPDDDLTLAVGDFVVNLRSALDHLVHELRGGGKRDTDSSFPIREFDMWEEDPATGRHIKGSDKERAKFLACLPGVPPPAIEAIKGYQPRNRVMKGKFPLFPFMSSIANADKHGDIFQVQVRLADVSVITTIGPYKYVGEYGGMLEPNAMVLSARARHDWISKAFPVASRDEREQLVRILCQPEPEVQVEVQGTPHISLPIPGRKTFAQIPDIFDRLIGDIEGVIVPELETFIP